MTTAKPPTRKPKPYASETELLAVFIAWLEREGWSCRQELAVRLPVRADDPGGRTREHVADLVAQRSDKLAIFEGKLRFGVEVVAQALRWRGYAHTVSVIAPHPGRMPSKNHKVQAEQCRAQQVGLIYITRDGRVKVEHPSPRWKHPDIGPLSHALSIGTSMTQQAGQAGPKRTKGARIDDWLQPMRAWLRANPGATGKEIAAYANWGKAQRFEFQRLAGRNELPHWLEVETWQGQRRFRVNVNTEHK